MKLNTENHKGDERKEVAAAIEDYKNKPSAKNENKVKKALNNYYDAFLFEQEKHIKDTEQSREARLTASFERFTSDRFRPKARQGQKLKEDDVLSEIICNYISIGSEIVPVNPEARVRERGFNAAINSAKSAYMKNPTKKNRELLKDEVTKAFRTAYDVRVEEFSKAKKKGDKGAVELSDKIIDDKFRNTQFEEITQQLNLYGRIDRMVTFGNNTFGSWQPRMRDDSRELAKLIREYKYSSDNESKEAVKNKFFMIYNEMLTVHEKHLYKIESEIDRSEERRVGKECRL